MAAAAVAAAAAIPATAPAARAEGVRVDVVTVRSAYLPGDDELGATTLYVPQGGQVVLTNGDVFAAHSLSSDVIDPVDGTRLFDSVAINFRESAPVVGVEALAPGSYTFHCTIHEDNMRGTLVVL